MKVLHSLTAASITVLGAAGSEHASLRRLRRPTRHLGSRSFVTATRRSVNLQDVPILIMALSSDDLEAQGIDSIERLQGVVPNLNSSAERTAPRPKSASRSAAFPRRFYIDGIWQPYIFGLMDLALEEIDRIEVLRGPQGTLYGRDSTAGRSAW